MNEQQSNALMNVRDIATRLNCSPSNVYSLVAAGELEAYRIGKGKSGLRFDEAILVRFLEKRKTGGPVAEPKRADRPHLKDQALNAGIKLW